MVDGDNRAREVSTTANTSNIEIKAQNEAEKYMLREMLKKDHLIVNKYSNSFVFVRVSVSVTLALR